ncbi:MAG: hypothetical protein ACRDMY_04080 [Gaiellaceae bacterium]
MRDLPDGAFVRHEGKQRLVLGRRLLTWTPAGYTAPRPRRGRAQLITPPSLVAVLETAWQGVVPLLHPSAH